MGTSEGGMIASLGDPSGRQDAEYWDAWFRAYNNNKDKEDPSSSSHSDSINNSDDTHDSNHLRMLPTTSTTTGSTTTTRPTDTTPLLPFEWYCSAEEVVRVISCHLSIPLTECRRYSIFHPGAGTSLVPIALQKAFPNIHLHQVMVDVSPIAIEHARKIISSAEVVVDMDFLVSDLLFEPSTNQSSASRLSYPEASFSAWIDKGFIDAVFSSLSSSSSSSSSIKSDDSDHCRTRRQAQDLFATARRLLIPNRQGVALMVSLAEDHSLQIIVENWIRGLLSSDKSKEEAEEEYKESSSWAPELHVYEVKPTSGTLRPFAFVLITAEIKTWREMKEKEDAQSSSFSPGEEAVAMSPLHILWHAYNTSTTTTKRIVVHRDTVFETLRQRIAASRKAFLDETAFTKKKQHILRNQNQVRAVIEVKPEHTEVNLEDLAHRILTSTWTLNDNTSSNDDKEYEKKNQSNNSNNHPVEIVWQPLTKNDSFDHGIIHYKIVPIGFGISKLRLQFIVNREELNDLVCVMKETLQEFVQSIDVDWQNTIPVDV